MKPQILSYKVRFEAPQTRDLDMQLEAILEVSEAIQSANYEFRHYGDTDFWDVEIEGDKIDHDLVSAIQSAIRSAPRCSKKKNEKSKVQSVYFKAYWQKLNDQAAYRMGYRSVP